MTLRIPKLRSLAFETATIERYPRREISVEQALVEMDLAGVSVRRVADITEALWGTRVSSGTVSRLNQKIDRHIEAWRNREIVGEFPYVFLDGVVLKRSWAGEDHELQYRADALRQVLLRQDTDADLPRPRTLGSREAVGSDRANNRAESGGRIIGLSVRSSRS